MLEIISEVTHQVKSLAKWRAAPMGVREFASTWVKVLTLKLIEKSLSNRDEER